ncbi:nuclear transport factor 2 family protein [Aquirufa sp. ROCK2-A2]
MKKIITSIIICLTSFIAMAQEKSAASLKEADLNRFKIMIAQDGAGLDKVLHNDLVYVHSSGTKDNKASYINSIVSKKTIYHKIDVIEITQRIYGNVGINNGIVHVVNLKDGVEQPANKLTFTDVYVFENGRWQMVSWQSTKLPVQ